MPRSMASARALADLARSGAAILREPFTQVNFEVHHGPDRRGRLRELVSVWLAEDSAGDRRAPEETLASGAYGTGLLVATRRGVLEPEMSVRHQGSSVPVRVRVEPEGDSRVFVGAARPNPTFAGRPAAVLEGMISIDERPEQFRHGHAMVLREVLRTVSGLAAGVAQAPLVSLQSPVHLPPQRYGRDGRPGTEVWGRSAAIAVRFSMSLPYPSASLRLQIVDELTAFCRDQGCGFWLTDTRRGYRAGNWVPVLALDQDRAAERVRPDPDGRHRAVRACLPVTLVGPARTGTAHAALEFLHAAGGVGVLGCTVTALNDLAFIHLLLVGSRGEDPDDAEGDGARAADAAAVDGDPGPGLSTDPQLALSAGVEAVAGPAAVVTDGAAELLRRVAGDYQSLVGPVLGVESVRTQRRVPVWVSWQMEGGNPGVARPLDALMHALEASGVGERETRDGVLDGPNVEYLVCRDLGNSVVRAKGKLSLPEDLVTLAGTSLESAPTRLCVRVEDVWRAAVRRSVGRPGLEDVAVAWREYWLAHARSS